MKKAARITAFLIALTVFTGLSLSVTAADKSKFEDVQNTDYFYSAVNWGTESGIIFGSGEKTFNPGGTVTRAQAVTFLWRMAGEPVVNYAMPYSDTEENGWYAEAVRWAAAEKIFTREDGEFLPNSVIPRDETVNLLWNYAKHSNADVSIGDETNILSYDDFAEISEEYVPAMKWAIGSALINGTSDRTLSPKGQLTRAQTVVMLQRLSGLLPDRAPLSLWNENAASRNELISYISEITDEASEYYIPIKDRIAVFDLDGTLFCETDPNYFDYTLLKYRVLEDEGYKDKASEFEREVANKIKEQNETGKSFSGLEVDHGKAVASAFSGMTVSEFNEYIQEFKKQPMPSYIGMTRGEGFYLPMVQVVNYLEDNGFTVYIVSGTDRLIVRGILYNSVLDIPNRHIIGSDETIIATGQGDTDGLNYVFSDGEELILGGDFIIKNLKMNKVSVIMQEIGQQPVLSFGNSTGDSSMAEFTTSNNRYRSLAFMLCCDDTERENGNISKADKMFELCREFKWIPISMKKDWSTVYGEGVTYTPEK